MWIKATGLSWCQHLRFDLKAAAALMHSEFSAMHFQLICRCCDEPNRVPCSWRHHSPPWSWGCSSCTSSTPAGWCTASSTPNLATAPRVTNASRPSWQGTPNCRYLHRFTGCFAFSKTNNKYVDPCSWCLCPCLSLSVQLSIYTALQANAEGGHTLIHKEDQFDVNSKFERFGLFQYYTK